MTTYGPTSLSLAERLAAAELVARVAEVELIRTEDDPASEHGRELGTFRLVLAEVIEGEPRDAVDVVVARPRDAAWPLPEKGEFLALVRGVEGERPAQLVHDSAFPITEDTVQVDTSSGLGGERARREKVSLDGVRELLAERAQRRKELAAALEERETSAFTPEHGPPEEMPDTHGLRDLLDLQHGEGGRSDEPLKPSRSQRPPDEVSEE